MRGSYKLEKQTLLHFLKVLMATCAINSKLIAINMEQHCIKCMKLTGVFQQTKNLFLTFTKCFAIVKQTQYVE